MPELAVSSASEFLAVEHIDASYGRIDVLKDVSVRIGEGRLVTLIGANGAGKTTFLKVISGLMPCRAGHVRLRGASIGRLSSDKRVRAGVVQVPLLL